MPGGEKVSCVPVVPVVPVMRGPCPPCRQPRALLVRQSDQETFHAP